MSVERGTFWQHRGTDAFVYVTNRLCFHKTPALGYDDWYTYVYFVPMTQEARGLGPAGKGIRVAVFLKEYMPVVSNKASRDLYIERARHLSYAQIHKELRIKRLKNLFSEEERGCILLSGEA